MDSIQSEPTNLAAAKRSSTSSPNSLASREETPDQQFCLRWNNYQANLTLVFDQLLQNESFVDVTLSTDEGQSLKCHKVVLSACSPYFQQLFIENPCQHPIVILRDVEFEDLKSVVEYMYKGEINVTHHQLAAILRTAEHLKVRGLDEMVRSSPAAASADEDQHRDIMRPHKKRRFSPDTLECIPKRLLKTRDDLFDADRNQTVSRYEPVFSVLFQAVRDNFLAVSVLTKRLIKPPFLRGYLS